MVDATKQKTRALMSFKTRHINRLVSKNLSLKRRDLDGFILEDIILAGKVVGTFTYDKETGRLTIEDTENDLHSKG